MVIKYYKDIVQGSDEWYALRCGVLTASEMKLILTPTLKIASNEKERAHLYELLAQRITKYVEPSYIGEDMLRGKEDEIEARIVYEKNYAPVQDMGFITNDKLGFQIGFSPDALAGEDGFIECKSRRQKYQIETILGGNIPEEYILQVQTGLLVTERKWCDFVSYCGGMHMLTIRAFPDPKIQEAICEAARAFEERLVAAKTKYDEILKSEARLTPTERKAIQDITL